jgi:hypothetical protein
MDELNQVRVISLKGGEFELEVKMTEAFIARVRQHFGLLVGQPLEDDHVSGYVLGALNTAVVKAEQQVSQDAEQPTEVA